MMTRLTRRSVLKAGAAGVLAAATSSSALNAVPPKARYVTSYYQYTDRAISLLGKVLPNGPEFLHVFVHSEPHIEPHAHRVKVVHSAGESFKYGCAFDLSNYRWQTASDDDLKRWVMKFRAAVLDASGPADYFAFNEMPDKAPEHPEVRAKVAKLIRYLHSLGGGPAWRGVFYFTLANLNPAKWVGPADDLWAAIDETCDFVIGERYESQRYVTEHSEQQLAAVLDVMPKFLAASGDPRQARIARDKFMIVHSSYYGPRDTNWGGLQDNVSPLKDMRAYLDKLVAATRMSEFGKTRIAFAPLSARDLSPDLVPLLADILKTDRCGQRG